MYPVRYTARVSLRVRHELQSERVVLDKERRMDRLARLKGMVKRIPRIDSPATAWRWN